MTKYIYQTIEIGSIGSCGCDAKLESCADLSLADWFPDERVRIEVFRLGLAS